MVGPSRLRYISHGLTVAAILAITPAFAADPNNGERLAHRWCEACHVVVVSSNSTPLDDRPGAAIREYCKDTGLRCRKDRVVSSQSASEDAEYGPISDGSGGSCGIYCNAQIVRPTPPQSSQPTPPQQPPPPLFDSKGQPPRMVSNLFGTFRLHRPHQGRKHSLASRQHDCGQSRDQWYVNREGKPHWKLEIYLGYQDNWHGQMTDDENRQPRSSIVSTKMPIRFAAYGAAVDEFEVVMQQ